jgi:mannose-6-phosphate isomerase-like protein (cupin superfamily)
MVERIENQGEEMAIIIRSNYSEEGIHFLTPDNYSQQLAYMHHKAGHQIIPHFHNMVSRTVHYTQEVLVIRKGRVKVNFYNTDKEGVADTILNAGDVILLCSGGHGFEILEETEMIEIKQGPYVGGNDKTRFIPKGK